MNLQLRLHRVCVRPLIDVNVVLTAFSKCWVGFCAPGATIPSPLAPTLTTLISRLPVAHVGGIDKYLPLCLTG